MSCSTQVVLKKLYKVAILTVSDSCHKKVKQDLSGDQMEKLLIEEDIFPRCRMPIYRDVAPDEQYIVEFLLSKWADYVEVDLILTIGGTGFSPRDVTPEATKRVCDREAPALTQAVISSCLKKTPFALLSRATCGIRKKTIIFNLPGSAKGSKECFLAVADILPHAIDQLKGDTISVEQCHMGIQGQNAVAPRKSKVDVSKVASRPRISVYKMLSSGDALEIVLEQCLLTDIKEDVFPACVGYVSASDVTAKFPLPPFRASIKDGYAAFAGEGKGIRKVLGITTAGDDPSHCSLEPGGCVRVSTGSPVPVNCDCVVQVEDTVVTKKTEEGDEEIEIDILKMPTPGQDIREVGSDIGIDAVILPKGKEITPFDCGVMAAAGICSLPVYSTPRVAILSTGDELIKAGGDAVPGCIFDTNNSTLNAILSKLNLQFIREDIAKDNPDDLLEKLTQIFTKSNVVVITGGMSMGEKDYVKDVLLEDFAAEMHFGRIHMKPGKPTGFFTLTYEGEKKLVFCLPGNPVSAAVTFHLFVVPCLRKMMGHKNITQLTMKAKLADDVLLDPRPEYHRVALTWGQDDKPVARSTGNQISSRMLSFSEANGLMLLPPQTAERSMLRAGTDVQVMLFDCFAPHCNSFYIY